MNNKNKKLKSNLRKKKLINIELLEKTDKLERNIIEELEEQVEEILIDINKEK